jgi:hypothetical protein
MDILITHENRTSTIPSNLETQRHFYTSNSTSIILKEDDPIPNKQLYSCDEDLSHTHNTNSETLGELGHLTTFRQRAYKELNQEDILQETLPASTNQQSSQSPHGQGNIQHNSQPAQHISQPLQNTRNEGGSTNEQHEIATTYTSKLVINTHREEIQTQKIYSQEREPKATATTIPTIKQIAAITTSTPQATTTGTEHLTTRENYIPGTTNDHNQLQLYTAESNNNLNQTATASNNIITESQDSRTQPTVRSTIQQLLPQYNNNTHKHNEAWGVSINNIPPTTFRIYFQNTNGLQYKTSQSRWKTHLEYMQEKGITISGGWQKLI